MRAVVLPAVVVLLACGGRPADMTAPDMVTVSVAISVPRPVGSPVAVGSEPPGIACDSSTVNCAAEFPRGTRVRLVAPHYALVEHTWGGICASAYGEETCAFEAKQNRRVPITFDDGFFFIRPVQHPIDVTVRGEGTVIGSNVAIVCPPVCEAPWARNASITAEPAPGWTFAGWQDGCHGVETCALTEGVPSVSAIFDPLPAGSQGGG